MEVEKFELLDTNNFHNIFLYYLMSKEVEREIDFFYIFLRNLIIENWNFPSLNFSNQSYLIIVLLNRLTNVVFYLYLIPKVSKG